MNVNIFQGKIAQIRALSCDFLRDTNQNLDLFIPKCEYSDSSFV